MLKTSEKYRKSVSQRCVRRTDTTHRVNNSDIYESGQRLVFMCVL